MLSQASPAALEPDFTRTVGCDPSFDTEPSDYSSIETLPKLNSRALPRSWARALLLHLVPYGVYTIAWYLVPDLLKFLVVVAHVSLLPYEYILDRSAATTFILDASLVTQSYHYLWKRRLLLDIYERAIWSTDPPHVIAVHGTFLTFWALSIWSLFTIAQPFWRGTTLLIRSLSQLLRSMTSTPRSAFLSLLRLWHGMQSVLQDIDNVGIWYSFMWCIIPGNLRFLVFAGYVWWEEHQAQYEDSLEDLLHETREYVLNIRQFEEELADTLDQNEVAIRQESSDGKVIQQSLKSDLASVKQEGCMESLEIIRFQTAFEITFRDIVALKEWQFESKSRMTVADLLISRTDAFLAERRMLEGEYGGIKEKCQRLQAGLAQLDVDVERFAKKCHAAWDEVVTNMGRNMKRVEFDKRIAAQEQTADWVRSRVTPIDANKQSIETCTVPV
ncbi:hypothetical protein OBBRIDRAFT_657083 [Obba rivulosa]|uniref:Uncharacterized protein n=1 Tax=Obba rivulosa TaxID=1052685 RepID=A0A8E2ASK3_9APHY|nr:hypothetical protein OBBRIDRAFT_657083 [Obba rivulosa]